MRFALVLVLATLAALPPATAVSLPSVIPGSCFPTVIAGPYCPGPLPPQVGLPDPGCATVGTCCVGIGAQPCPIAAGLPQPTCLTEGTCCVVIGNGSCTFDCAPTGDVTQAFQVHAGPYEHTQLTLTCGDRSWITYGGYLWLDGHLAKGGPGACTSEGAFEPTITYCGRAIACVPDFC